MNSCARLCVAIGFVALITVSDAATVVKEFTCDYSTQDGCDGYKVRNLTQMSNGISTIVGKHGSLVSNRMFGIKDIERLCVEFNYNVYSEFKDDNIQLTVLFGMNTTKGMVMYDSQTMNARGSRFRVILSRH